MAELREDERPCIEPGNRMVLAEAGTGAAGQAPIGVNDRNHYTDRLASLNRRRQEDMAVGFLDIAVQEGDSLRDH